MLEIEAKNLKEIENNIYRTIFLILKLVFNFIDGEFHFSLIEFHFISTIKQRNLKNKSITIYETKT